MNSFKNALSASALVLLFATGQATAQSATPSNSPPTFVTQQPTGQSLASMFVGQDVTNAAGDKVGDISDVLFDKSGRITGVVVGVGGILGLGEKYVAVPFDALAISSDGKGARVVTVGLSKDSMRQAPEFKPTEKTTFMKAKEKAGELIDQAGKKIEEFRKDEPK